MIVGNNIGNVITYVARHQICPPTLGVARQDLPVLDLVGGLGMVQNARNQKATTFPKNRPWNGPNTDRYHRAGSDTDGQLRYGLIDGASSPWIRKDICDVAWVGCECLTRQWRAQSLLEGRVIA